MSHDEPRSIINHSRMSGFQVWAVAICIVLNALDGFDVLAITFAAPDIAKAWALGPGALGIVIATGLAGMIIGALLLAPFADVIGRRRVIVVSLVAMAGGMLLSATATGVYSLAAWRVLTGVGIGGMLAAVTAMVAEYANDRHRNLCVSLMSVGYPAGGVLGGLASVWLLEQFGWRSVFIFGGVVSALALPIVWWRLPESIEFLASRGTPEALEQINDVLARMGHRRAAQLSPPTAEERRRGLDVFSRELLPRTLAVCSAYFLHIMTTYYVLGWIPSIVATLGFSASAAASVSVWASLGGILSGVCFGYAARFVGLTWLAILAMLGTAGMLAVFGHASAELGVLRFVAAALGFFMYAGVVCLYASFARVFPAHARVTGTGFVIGVGRFGGMLGPAVGGWLMLSDLGRLEVAMTMGLGSVLAAVAMLRLRSILVVVPQTTPSAKEMAIQ